MSSIDIAAGEIKKLSDEEWQVLRALERISLNRRIASVEAISRSSGQPMDRVTYALDQLNKRGLAENVRENAVMQTAGLDILALKYHADNNNIAALGKAIAKGKESDVYEAVSENGELSALKFFRIGRTSFRDVKRKRQLEGSEMHSWMTRNNMAASREYRSLKKLRRYTKNVPEALGVNRHTVLMGEVLGVKLSERPELRSPSVSLRTIINTTRIAYLKAGLIDGDLSEYNILSDGKKVWLIDWPQWVTRSHPNARELLERDVYAVLRFFDRAYAVTMDREEAMKYVLGESKTLPPIIRPAKASNR